MNTWRGPTIHPWRISEPIILEKIEMEIVKQMTRRLRLPKRLFSPVRLENLKKEPKIHWEKAIFFEVC